MSSPHSWPKKFSFAISGILRAVRNQNSFWIHLPITVAVMGLAAWLQVEPWRWIAVLFAITIVWSVELLNTSIELLVKVLHPEHDEKIGQALDASAGAVLVTAIGAVIVGLIVLAPPLLAALGLLD